MFKAVIGRGHQEFSSMRQQVRTDGDVVLVSVDVCAQDAQEFFLHFLSTIDKGQRLTTPAARNSADLFRFQFEDRVECVVSGKVRYTKRDDFLLQLPVPMDLATNKGDKGVAMFTGLCLGMGCCR